MSPYLRVACVPLLLSLGSSSCSSSPAASAPADAGVEAGPTAVAYPACTPLSTVQLFQTDAPLRGLALAADHVFLAEPGRVLSLPRDGGGAVAVDLGKAVDELWADVAHLYVVTSEDFGARVRLLRRPLAGAPFEDASAFQDLGPMPSRTNPFRPSFRTGHDDRYVYAAGIVEGVNGLFRKSLEGDLLEPLLPAGSGLTLDSGQTVLVGESVIAVDGWDESQRLVVVDRGGGAPRFIDVGRTPTPVERWGDGLLVHTRGERQSLSLVTFGGDGGTTITSLRSPSECFMSRCPASSLGDGVYVGTMEFVSSPADRRPFLKPHLLRGAAASRDLQALGCIVPEFPPTVPWPDRSVRLVQLAADRRGVAMLIEKFSGRDAGSEYSVQYMPVEPTP